MSAPSDHDLNLAAAWIAERLISMLNQIPTDDPAWTPIDGASYDRATRPQRQAAQYRRRVEQRRGIGSQGVSGEVPRTTTQRPCLLAWWSYD
jgi:hypothetical protein